MKHFEFKGSLGEFLDKIDEYFGLKDMSKKVNAVIDIQDDEKEVRSQVVRTQPDAAKKP